MINEQAHITGVALIPRISRNDNLYTKEELKRFDNITVPLNWEHDEHRVIGEVTFHYNPDMETVFYEGDITDEPAANLARNKTLFTSIEADPVSMKDVCNSPGDCFHMPFGLVPVGMALTETPGVPETSVKVIEHYIQECQHDQGLEAKYAPTQKNLKNEQHIQNLIEVGNPGIDDQCVQTWISRLADEDPTRSQDQNIAIAFSKCSSTESLRFLMKEFFKLRESLMCPDCGNVK